MKIPIFLALALGLTSCSSYNPIDDELELRVAQTGENEGVVVQFLGNTTLHITDGETVLLVDGFLSRPGLLKTLFGKIGPSSKVVDRELELAGIDQVDAVLIGHSHHDHSLDAPYVVDRTSATVMGSDAYQKIHEGNATNPDVNFINVEKDGNSHSFGHFKVTLVESDHVTSHSFLQEAVEGPIETPFPMPAHFSNFKCGQVFAIHIAHPDGSLLVTTTAGAVTGALDGYQADVVFLGIGLLSKESDEKREIYWSETVEAVNPHTVVPVHWDAFSRKLSRGLKPLPKWIDDVEFTINDLQQRADGQRNVRVLDLREKIRIRPHIQNH